MHECGKGRGGASSLRDLIGQSSASNENERMGYYQCIQGQRIVALQLINGPKSASAHQANADHQSSPVPMYHLTYVCIGLDIRHLFLSS